MGCAANRVVRVVPGEPIELAADEAFLIVHIDTDVDLMGVKMHTGSVARELPKGEHLWIVRVRGGEGRWRRVDFGREYGRRAHADLDTWTAARRGEFLFEIDPGVINYPGSLVVRTEIYPGVKNGNRVEVRHRNRSAMAIRHLLDTHAEFLASLPLHYGGSSGDGFLEFYGAERRRDHTDAQVDSE